MPKLRGRRLEEYGRIMARERRGLLVSKERQAWILETYPPADVGRPGDMATNALQPTSVGRDVGQLERHEEDGLVFWRPKNAHQNAHQNGYEKGSVRDERD